MADTGKVHIWALSDHVRLIEDPKLGVKLPSKPIFSYDGHKEEGFALDWSPKIPFR